MGKIKIFSIILILILVLECGKKIKEESEHKEEHVSDKIELKNDSVNLAGLKFEKVERRTASDYVRVRGEVTFNPKRLSIITAFFSGIVKETFYFEGDRVRKGDRLALIFSRDLLSAQSDYLLILKRYKRAMLKEDEDKILMEKMLNSSKLRLEMLGLDEEVIEKIKINEEASPFHYIKAPIEGTVIESNAVTGVQFQEGSILFKIADVRSLWIQVNIYEKDLFGLKNGLEAEVWVPSNPEKKFKGILKVIGEVLDKETRTLKGRIEVTDRTENLKPGMFVEAAIYKNKNEKILSVSDKAIRKMEGKDVVFVVKGENEFEIREVKPGRTFGELREIIHGLEEGEIVVSEGSFVLKSHAMSGKMEVD